MKGYPLHAQLTYERRTGEAKSNLDRADLDSKLVFKTGQKVDLGLQEATRKVIHQGEVSRKSDNKLDWLHIHLILMDNYLIMTKKKMDRGVEKLFVSKQVSRSWYVADIAYPSGFTGIGGGDWRCGLKVHSNEIGWNHDDNRICPSTTSLPRQV